MIWPVLALYVCWIAPQYDWWFPGDGESDSPLGGRIDHLFYLILWITTAVFIGTQIALGYVLWTASQKKPEQKASHFHGNHTLEVIWTVIPSAILLFIAIYQMQVWAEFRIKSAFPDEAKKNIIAEVSARQFEWRIRYPAPGEKLQSKPQVTDMHAVNELHVPAGVPVTIQLRTQDVQHSFFLPTLRIKQDAVPGLVIPVWFEAKEPGEYPWVCAELCGWGHYKMPGKIIAHPADEYDEFMKNYYAERYTDGYPQESPEGEVATTN